MEQTISYSYGNGDEGFSFSQAQEAILESDIGVALANINSQGDGQDIYEDVLAAIEASPTGLTTVDPNVEAWLVGAEGVNDDSTSAGQFIRAYTSNVYTIR